MVDYGCNKCQKHKAGMYPTKLVGGVRAYLCPDCATDFHKFVIADAHFYELKLLDVELNAVIIHGDRVTAREIETERQELLEELFVVSLGWLEDVQKIEES